MGDRKTLAREIAARSKTRFIRIPQEPKGKASRTARYCRGLASSICDRPGAVIDPRFYGDYYDLDWLRLRFRSRQPEPRAFVAASGRLASAPESGQENLVPDGTPNGPFRSNLDCS